MKGCDLFWRRCHASRLVLATHARLASTLRAASALGCACQVGAIPLQMCWSRIPVWCRNIQPSLV